MEGWLATVMFLVAIFIDATFVKPITTNIFISSVLLVAF
jgi:hypothetical protein